MTKTTTETDEWSCNDLVLVTTLQLAGQEVLSMDFDEQMNSVYWFFRDTDELRDQIEAFMTNEARVDPKTYSVLYVKNKDDMIGLLRRNGNRRNGR